ncbi:DUF1642 domain-containing protein [Lactococcus lactis]|uniref:DUF1642 domain-containing protein n=1 Tax=Lactococcus lactis TaxID=1358 RepID=UPI0025A0B867|nr:DUF1642 domain-containing protein [Lactococcus lactis]MDM7657416.1 DUF1642 domain-containing protein [Lactococcus lactis]
MTKFEEEFKALTSWDWVNVDLIQKILTKFGNWHPDEEYQELFDKYSNLNDSYEKEVIRSSKLESQIIDLKSQLQQQALPVVPEEVDKAIKYLKTQNNFATLTDLKNLDILTEKGFWWLNDFQFKDRRFGFGGLNNKLFILSHLAITGYQVEKPQLFYLKNKLTTSYLELDKTNDYFHHTMNPAPYYDMTRKSQFTQQEIDSMQTGSYEQFAVPVEDGE